MVLLRQGAAGQAVVTGRVVEDSTWMPINGAVVRVLHESNDTAAVVVADSSGGFTIRGPLAGRYRLTAGGLGYAGMTTEVLVLGPDDTARVELRLRVGALALEPLVVVGTRDDRLRRWGFHDRVAQYGSSGFGRFLTEADIDRHKVLRVSEVLREVPRLRYVDVGRRQEIRIIRATGYCAPTFYVDGHVVPAGNGFTIDDHVTLSQVVAIEVYAGPVAPPQYPSRTNCGVIMIWTGPR